MVREKTEKLKTNIRIYFVPIVVGTILDLRVTSQNL